MSFQPELSEHTSKCEKMSEEESCTDDNKKWLQTDDRRISKPVHMSYKFDQPISLSVKPTLTFIQITSDYIRKPPTLTYITFDYRYLKLDNFYFNKNYPVNN